MRRRLLAPLCAITLLGLAVYLSVLLLAPTAAWAAPAPTPTPAPRRDRTSPGTRPSKSPDPVPPDRQRASDTSLLRWLEAATERIQRLEQDNQQLRDALARALGERRTADILDRPHARDTPNDTATKIIGPG